MKEGDSIRNLLSTFITVYELGTFSKVAEVLYISQPTISIQIKKSEDIIDTQFFI